MGERMAAVVLAGILFLVAGPATASTLPAHRSGPALAAPPDFNVPAAQLRVGLNRVLSEHAFLLAEAMRAGLSDTASFDAAGAALEENSAELEGMVGEVYGSDAAVQFGDTWRSHVAYLVDYTRALAQNDAEAEELAEQQLHQYVTDFSALLEQVNPNLPAASVEQLVGEHVQQLEAIAAFDAGDYDAAYPAIRQTYAHMFTIGDALAEAIAVQFPDTFKGKSLAFSPAGDLRVAIDQLLGEHTMLAIMVTRASLGVSPDESAARAALEANTRDLGAAIEEIYGGRGGRAFVALWSAHTDAYVRYVESTIGNDTAGREQAMADLRRYRDDFSSFLAEANPELSAADLRSMVEHHTEQLIAQVDTFSAADYDAAYSVTRDAFAHSFEMGDALALAIAAQFPNRFPDAATDRPGGSPIGGALLIAAALVLTVWRRRRLAAAVRLAPRLHGERAGGEPS